MVYHRVDVFFLHARLNHERARRLENGAKGNTGETSADEVVVGAGGGVLATGDVLLALLVEEVLQGHSNDGDCIEVSIEKYRYLDVKIIL